MQEPVLHYATDRRCYYGAMCSDLQKEIDSKTRIFTAIKKVCPEFSCVYFPVEGKYMTFIGHKTLTNLFFEDQGECLLQAWRILVGKTEITYCRLS